MENGIVNRKNGGLFPYQAWPTLARDENGILYVAASSHRAAHICPFGQNHLYESRDNGKTWSAPRVVNDTPLDDRDAGLLSLGNGKLLLTWFDHSVRDYQTTHRAFIEEHARPLTKEMTLSVLDGLSLLPEKEQAGGSYVRISSDSGRTWGKQIKVPVTSPHGPIRLADSRLLYLGKEFHSGRYAQGEIYALESRDEGESWQCIGHVDFPAGYDRDSVHEPHAVEAADGTLLGFLRVRTKEMRMALYLCRSHDGGRTWSEPRCMGHHGAPAHVLKHSTGALILAYSYRLDAPMGIRVRISHDNGESWSEPKAIGLVSPTWDCGYPSSAELADGSILTVYYGALEGDDFNSLLYTKWRLEELE